MDFTVLIRLNRLALLSRRGILLLVVLGPILCDAASPPENTKNAEYWWQRPSLKLTRKFPILPKLRSNDIRLYKLLQDGQFSPRDLFPPEDIGVPPPWGTIAGKGNTWDFYRHTLRWLEPAIRVWKVERDRAALELVLRTLHSWSEANRQPPGASRKAWTDHTIASRLQVLLWFWELYRTDDMREADETLFLLGLIVEHASHLQAGTNFNPLSNHGLVQVDSLFAAAVALRPLPVTVDWAATAARRLNLYCKQNFSEQGFHFEQSPFYQGYTAVVLLSMCHFLNENDAAVPEFAQQTARRVAGVFPYLIYPDGRYVPFGDSEPEPARSALKKIRNYSTLKPIAPRDCRVNPRGDGTRFLICQESGYAILTDKLSSAKRNYLAFRARAFKFTHAQRDALTFVFFANGVEWITDAGKYNYAETDPIRQYMRGALAHNVVLVDRQPFEFGATTVEPGRRTMQADIVASTHELKNANHRREIHYSPAGGLQIRDRLTARGGRAHEYTQLFHLPPDLEPEITSVTTVTIRAANGSICFITQADDGGRWEIIRGKGRGGIEGWYSPDFNKVMAAPVLVYSRRGVDVNFRTSIRVEPASGR